MKCLPLLISTFSLHQIVARSQRGVLSGTRAKNDSYSILARAIQLGVNDDTSNYSADAIALALRSLSKAQATLKKIDGTGVFLIEYSVEVIVLCNLNSPCVRVISSRNVPKNS